MDGEETMKAWKILALLTPLLFMHQALAMDWHEALSGSRLVIGITAKETQLEVRDPDNASHDYGTLTSDIYETPLLSFYTPDIYFRNSRGAAMSNSAGAVSACTSNSPPP
jgi:hypothetical protein